MGRLFFWLVIVALVLIVLKAFAAWLLPACLVVMAWRLPTAVLAVPC